MPSPSIDNVVLQHIFERFDTGHYTYLSSEPYGSGHINDTFRIETTCNTTTNTTNTPSSSSLSSSSASQSQRYNNNNNNNNNNKKKKYYILQRINHDIFTRPWEVMDNIHRITQHLSTKIKARGGDVSRETLTLIPVKKNETTTTGTNTGSTGNNNSNDDDDDDDNHHKNNKNNTNNCPPSSSCWFTIVDGNYWRMYNFITDARTYEIGESSSSNNNNKNNKKNNSMNHIKEAAAAFARFQRDVADLPLPKLYETIPGFGNTILRFQQFQQSIKINYQSRTKDCQEEINFCLTREKEITTTFTKLVFLLEETKQEQEEQQEQEQQQIPILRYAHYDTKINNVLIDNKTGYGICVIDLDTVMPGLVLYDFGDCVRATTALAGEDEQNLKKVGFCMDKFKVVTEGYISVAYEFLTPMELHHLAFAARLVTFTIGLRFLTDHLAGDIYFKVQRKGQNLDRARTQFKIVSDMEQQYDAMKAVVDQCIKKVKD